MPIIAEFGTKNLIWGDIYAGFLEAFSVIPKCLNITEPRYRFGICPAPFEIPDDKRDTSCTMEEASRILTGFALSGQPPHPFEPIRGIEYPSPPFFLVDLEDASSELQCHHAWYLVWISGISVISSEVCRLNWSKHKQTHHIDRDQFIRNLLGQLSSGVLDEVGISFEYFCNFASAYLYTFLRDRYGIDAKEYNIVNAEMACRLLAELSAFSSDLFTDNEEYPMTPEPGEWLSPIIENMSFQTNSQDICRSFHNTMLETEPEWYRQALTELGVKPEAITLL